MADKKRGRPPKPMPEPIDDTPENVARARRLAIWV